MPFQIPSGEGLTVRVIQSANNGTVKWANTLEYVATSDIDNDDAFSIANSVAIAIGEMLINQYVVEKVVVSTYVPDSRPYNPDAFISFPFNIRGDRGRFSEDPVDLSICLRFDKRSTSGRTGRMLMRGVLHEGMLRTTGGRFNFMPPGGLDGVDFNDGLSRLADIITLPKAQMAMISSYGIRNVSNLVVAGITIKKLNNKYFDRQ